MEFSLLGWPRHLLQGMRAQWMVLGGWNWYNSYAFTLNRPQPNWTLMGAMCYRALSCVRQRSEEWKEKKKNWGIIYLFVSLKNSVHSSNTVPDTGIHWIQIHRRCSGFCVIVPQWALKFLSRIWFACMKKTPQGLQQCINTQQGQ